MAAKGYCTKENVAAFLGETFTTAQNTLCDELIEQAEIYIDNYTERGWLVGAQTDEAFYAPPYLIYLRYTPIDSVSAITARTDLGEAETALVLNTDYEVRDLESGLIGLETPSEYDRVLVDYTPTASVPADIKRACIELVATWIQPALNSGMFGVDSYTLPDLSVKFSRSHTQQAQAPTVNAILEKYRYVVHA